MSATTYAPGRTSLSADRLRGGTLTVEALTKELGRPPRFTGPAKRPDEVVVVYGQALAYRSLSRPMIADRPDGKGKFAFVEQVMPGAAHSVMGDDVELDVDHELRAYASAADGSLRFHDTPAGLFYAAEIRDVAQAGVLIDLFARRAVRGASIGFSPLRDEVSWSRTTTGVPARTIKGLALRSLAITTIQPVYTSSSAHLWRGSRSELRKLGLPGQPSRGEPPCLPAIPAPTTRTGSSLAARPASATRTCSRWRSMPISLP